MMPSAEGWDYTPALHPLENSEGQTMSTGNHPADNQDEAPDRLLPAHSEEEINKLEERLAELRAQGILTGGDGPKGTLRPVARVPGALERFLSERE